MQRLMSLYVGKLTAVIADRRAATAIEYGLIASLIIVVIVVSVRAVGNNVFSHFYNEIATALS